MTDQEFRDRCARAMGLTLTEPQRFGRYWEGPGVWVYAEDWKPDVDFNQAMMMRDKVPIFKSKRYAEVLEQITCVRADECSKPLQSHPLVCGSTLFATARQIAEAALKVLEAKEASSARTQEDK